MAKTTWEPQTYSDDQTDSGKYGKNKYLALISRMLLQFSSRKIWVELTIKGMR